MDHRSEVHPGLPSRSQLPAPSRLHLKVKVFWRNYEHWVAAAAAVLGSSWFADAFRESGQDLWMWMTHRDQMLLRFDWQRFFWMMPFLAATGWLIRVKRRFSTLHMEGLAPNADPPKRKVLITFLSDLKDCPHLEFQKNKLVLGEKRRRIRIEMGTNFLDRLREVRTEKRIKVPWETNWRMIRHHYPQLERIVLVCSDQTLRYARLFEEITLAFCKSIWSEPEDKVPCLFVLCGQTGDESVVFDCLDGWNDSWSGFDFADGFTKISMALSTAIDQLAKEKYRQSDLAIDFTSGPKIVSVIAVSFTYNRRIQAQYVDREKVKGYNLHYSDGNTQGLA